MSSTQNDVVTSLIGRSNWVINALVFTTLRGTRLDAIAFVMKTNRGVPQLPSLVSNHVNILLRTWSTCNSLDWTARLSLE
nr:hypothetical transcript [Hymenolepis microstoma]